MKIKEQLCKMLSVVVLAAMITQISSCGTLLYPERRNSNPKNEVTPEGRRIDPAVAILDGVCLIFFIIPGVIAFVVDFATGAIYLPKTSQTVSLSNEPKENLLIYIAPGVLNQDAIKQAVRQNTGVNFSFDDKRMEAYVIGRNFVF